MCRCPARLRPRRRLRSRLRLLEGGDEQHVLLALDQDFSLQPKAGAGNNEREAPDAVLRRTPQPSTTGPLGPMLTRPLLIRADFDRVPISGRRFLHREGPPCWLHDSIHTCVYVRHPR
jgi:hypothetical protein